MSNSSLKSKPVPRRFRLWNRIHNPDFPFAPRSVPLFYGWVILVVSIVGMVMSIPGQTIGVGVFTDDLIRITGLSRFEISLAYMLGTIASSLILPFSGKLLDLWGARIMVIVTSIGLGFSLVLLAGEPWVVNRIGKMLNLFQLTALHFAMMILIFLFLRQFGQGILAMVSRTMLSKWFDRRRGLASGINGVVVSFSFSASPMFLNWMITQSDWQKTALILAGIVGVGMSLCGWLFFRDNPEECGLKMDGPLAGFGADQSSPVPQGWVKEYTIQEARKTYTFWIFNLGISFHALLITAFTFHVVSIAELSGLSRAEAFAFFLPMSIVSTSTNFFVGWLSDRMELRYLLVVMMGTMTLSSWSLIHLDSSVGRYGLIGALGISGGIWGCLSMVAWPRFFGRKHLGAISGLNMGSMVFASAIGPALFGGIEAWSGNYDVAAWICVILTLILGFGALKAKNPQKDLLLAK